MLPTGCWAETPDKGSPKLIIYSAFYSEKKFEDLSLHATNLNTIWQLSSLQETYSKFMVIWIFLKLKFVDFCG